MLRNVNNDPEHSTRFMSQASSCSRADSFPYIKYISGQKKYKGNKYKNHLKFYNIFRDISTDDHAQQHGR